MSLANDALADPGTRRGPPIDAGTGRPDTARAARILAEAAARGRADGLGYAGKVTPREAWELASCGAALIVDVRTAEELHFVGRVPDALHVPWATGLAMTANANFVAELEAVADKRMPVLFLCRSAKRSHAAAEAAARAGFRHAMNILEGFEGDLDGEKQRGKLGGWRIAGLPWLQD